MSSEIQASEKEEWLKHKTTVGIGLGDIVACARQKLKDMMPSIQIIKDKQLWKHGGYDSFKDFCELGLSVTRQRIYQLLTEDDSRKLLEFQQTESTKLTPEDEPEPPKRPEKKAKAREIKPATVIEIESTTGPAEPIPEALDPAAISYAPPSTADEELYFDFTLPVNDDVIWFKALTPAKRLEALARARQQP